MAPYRGWALERGVFRSKYARSGHYVVFYLHNLKVFTLRILKYSVGKSAKNESGQLWVFSLVNTLGRAIMGCFTYRI